MSATPLRVTDPRSLDSRSPPRLKLQHSVLKKNGANHESKIRLSTTPLAVAMAYSN